MTNDFKVGDRVREPKGRVGIIMDINEHIPLGSYLVKFPKYNLWINGFYLTLVDTGDSKMTNDLKVGDRVCCDIAMCPNLTVYATVMGEQFKNSQGKNFIRLKFDRPQHGSRIRNVPVDVLDKCNDFPRFHKCTKKELISYIELLEAKNES